MKTLSSTQLEIIEKITETWSEYPDLRFGQLLFNLDINQFAKSDLADFNLPTENNSHNFSIPKLLFWYSSTISTFSFSVNFSLIAFKFITNILINILKVKKNPFNFKPFLYFNPFNFNPFLLKMIINKKRSDKIRPFNLLIINLLS